MRTLFVVLFTLCAALPLSACSKSEDKASAEPAAKAAATGHAAANVKAGSHEDWCDEHQVPESQCTLCNPTLSAGGKSNGDWCAEHGLPKSHCLKCNPDLKITRPAKTN